MTNNDEIVKRAHDLAARNGGFWFKYLNQARDELGTDAVQKAASLGKQFRARDTAATEKLNKAAVAAQLRQLPGVGDPVAKRRVTVDDIEIVGGHKVQVVDDRAEQGIVVAGIATRKEDVPAGLRSQFDGASARFDEAQTLDEQRAARETIERIVRQVLERNKTLETAVRARLGQPRNS
jgi:hypothetical protein